MTTDIMNNTEATTPFLPAKKSLLTLELNVEAIHNFFSAKSQNVIPKTSKENLPKVMVMVAMKKDNKDFFQYLHQQNYDLDTDLKSWPVKDNQGDNLLTWACCEGSLRVAKFLLENGCDVHHQAQQGETPLSIAALYATSAQHAKIINQLLDQNASANTQNKEGYAPIHNYLRHAYYKSDKDLSVKEHYDTFCRLLSLTSIDLVRYRENSLHLLFNLAVGQRHDDFAKKLVASHTGNVDIYLYQKILAKGNLGYRHISSESIEQLKNQLAIRKEHIQLEKKVAALGPKERVASSPEIGGAVQSNKKSTHKI